MSIKVISLTIFMFFVLSFYAQDDVKFRRYNIDEGLSQGNVNTIIQDKKGFIWAGTQDGLNRFDGYNFKVYKPNPDDPIV
ncbi:MAG: hypothetical protein IPO21_12355 [Bacteroidales bacterium]|nr:hypothetical protein [Bacteroidales bacterium]